MHVAYSPNAPVAARVPPSGSLRETVLCRNWLKAVTFRRYSTNGREVLVSAVFEGRATNRTNNVDLLRTNCFANIETPTKDELSHALSGERRSIDAIGCLHTYTMLSNAYRVETLKNGSSAICASNQASLTTTLSLILTDTGRRSPQGTYQCYHTVGTRSNRSSLFSVPAKLLKSAWLPLR